MASVKPILRLDKTAANGEAPIYLRLTKNRKSSYKFTGLRLDPKYWNDQSLQIKPNHPSSAQYNNRLARLITDATGAIIQLEEKDPGIQSPQIFHHLTGKNKPSFLQYCELILDRSKHTNAVGTIDKNNSVLTKIKSYMDGKDLRLEDINAKWLADYEFHLRDHHGNKTNTVKNSMKFIGRVLRQATNEELLEYQRNPFITGRYKIKSEDTNIEFLTLKELQQLEDCDLTAGTRIEQHKNLFVFACYAAGIRIGDLITMKWDSFDGERLQFTTRKTGTPINIKLPNRALSILRALPNYQCRSGFIFNLVDENIDTSNLRAMDNAISKGTAYVNKNLKILAKKVGLNKKLHFHMSRHTWATRAVKLMPIETVSKLLGHRSLRTTMIYVKLANEDLDDAMDRFN